MEWCYICPKCNDKAKEVIAIWETGSRMTFSLSPEGLIDVEDAEYAENFETYEEPDYYRCTNCNLKLSAEELAKGAKKWADTPEGKAKLLKNSN